MKKSLILLLSVLFIGINIFLLEKDGSKAKRVTHLSQWDVLNSGNLEETLQTEGMVVPAEKQPIFLDPQTPFKNFLVENGEVVEKGTPLFEYESSHQEEQLAVVDAEISRLESEKENINFYIEELVRMKANFYTIDVFSQEKPEVESQAAKAVEAASLNGLSLSLDQTIAEKELEKSNIEETIQQYETQRETIQNGMNGLTIYSPVEGTVTALSLELKNPIMSIFSKNTIVEGQLSEKQVEKVQLDMPVKLYSSELDKKITGKVILIEELPLENAALDQPSFYRFTIEPETEDEKWRVGHHLQAKIILAEAHGVPIVSQKSVVKNGRQAFLWALTEDGTLEERPIQRGLLVDKRQEITSGMKTGEYYVPNPKEVRKTSPFITSFQWDKQMFHTWKEFSSRKIIKYLLVGLLQR
ncbi:hypothetical protein ACA30_04250 [Virgibacillus soli]|uniref:efflux RND transporter periplasmic adaptor subunit n=1 Tax=Lederbergia galactosidilytica TaxID=217031 RepID=UPI000714D299|nr:efflux RND transporter periplasmic adaptor subunit [Lederbergia galactosidilytica]KRG15795.1 hypothetical protein ACA30_04250 [Virgibacillus soli]MBP1915478.1 HlyD family secretion protein [Lederbergia galactosidilytica]